MVIWPLLHTNASHTSTVQSIEYLNISEYRWISFRNCWSDGRLKNHPYSPIASTGAPAWFWRLGHHFCGHRLRNPIRSIRDRENATWRGGLQILLAEHILLNAWHCQIYKNVQKPSETVKPWKVGTSHSRENAVAIQGIGNEKTHTYHTFQYISWDWTLCAHIPTNIAMLECWGIKKECRFPCK